MRKEERKGQGGQARAKSQMTMHAHVKTATKFKLAHRVVDSGNHHLAATRPPPRCSQGESLCVVEENSVK